MALLNSLFTDLIIIFFLKSILLCPNALYTASLIDQTLVIFSTELSLIKAKSDSETNFLDIFKILDLNFLSKFYLY